MNRPCCPKCRHRETVKNGKVSGKQRHKCKGCSYQFTRCDKVCRPEKVINTALKLYVLGLSMRGIARLLGVSAPAVLYWIRTRGTPLAGKPQPEEGETVVLELDEMWHFLEKKRTSSGFGKPMAGLGIVCWTGNAAVAILPSCAGS